MFERFTQDAREAVVQAQREARALCHPYIGSEHLLLGLLGAPEDNSARALGTFGLTADEVRERVIALVGHGAEPSTAQIPFTPRSKKILELALRESLTLGTTYVGTEHLLLGLLRGGDGVAIRVLLGYGMTVEGIRQTVLTLEPGPEGSRSSRVQPREEAGAALEDVATVAVDLADSHEGMQPPGVGEAVEPMGIGEAVEPMGIGETVQPPGVGFSVIPDPQARRLLMAAAGRALAAGRTHFGVADVISAIRADDGTRELLDPRVDPSP